jgi:hypothetical protein
MHSRSLFRRGVALGLMVSLAACYTQRPLAMAVPTPQTRIVATVTDSGVVAMSNAIGPGSTQVEGVVVSADAETWTLQLLRVEYRGGQSVMWNREQVSFPRSALTNASERTLDKKRSWMTAGIITASALLVGGLFGVITGGEGGEEPPIPSENVVPAGGRSY